MLQLLRSVAPTEKYDTCVIVLGVNQGSVVTFLRLDRENAGIAVCADAKARYAAPCHAPCYHTHN